jgi:hypothetical protein
MIRFHLIAMFLPLLALAEEPRGELVHDVEIPDGTPVRLKLVETVSSAVAKVDDRVSFEVSEDVSVNGVKVMTKGSAAWAVVVEAAARARMRRQGKLVLNIEAVCTADKGKVKLRAHRNVLAALENAPPPDTSLAESMFALPAWPILMFMQGQEQVIPQGKEATVYVDGRGTVRPERLSPEPVKDCGGAADRPMGASELSTVHVTSRPIGAEIVVDGRYAGNTPAVLRLAAGERMLAIQHRGRTWKRSVSLTPGGSTTVSAAFEDLVEPSSESK